MKEIPGTSALLLRIAQSDGYKERYASGNTYVYRNEAARKSSPGLHLISMTISNKFSGPDGATSDALFVTTFVIKKQAWRSPFAILKTISEKSAVYASPTF